MAKYVIDGTTLASIADSIRNKKGTTGNITPENMPTEIASIETGGGGSDTAIEDGLITRTLSGAYTNNRITTIGQRAFHGCTNITSFSFPNVKSVQSDAFSGVKAKTLDLPSVTSFSANALTSASGFTSVHVPLLATSGTYGFRACYDLPFVDFPKLTSVPSGMFYDCRSLKTIILRKTGSVAALGSTSAFTNCYHFHGTKNSTYNPNGDKDGYIYVPAALIESYKAATNWSTFASQFRAIEDYPEITGG